jgi:hypothetical protein
MDPTLSSLVRLHMLACLVGEPGRPDQAGGLGSRRLEAVDGMTQRWRLEAGGLVLGDGHEFVLSCNKPSCLAVYTRLSQPRHVV